jgi:hypothetical protein
MTYRSFLSMITLLALTMLVLSACSSASPMSIGPAPASTSTAIADPFAYCAAVGQIDAPDARYTGPQMSDALFKAYLKAAGLDQNRDYPDTFKQMTIWRCMGGKLYACNFGANIPCDSKADTNQTPTQAMNDYCKQSPASDFIPASVTGHTTIYSWHCVKDAPAILNQLGAVDAAGYQSSYWQVVDSTP